MTATELRLGFIGLGAMGRPMALHLINALIGSGGGKSDFSRMIEVLERAAGSDA